MRKFKSTLMKGILLCLILLSAIFIYSNNASRNLKEISDDETKLSVENEKKGLVSSDSNVTKSVNMATTATTDYSMLYKNYDAAFYFGNGTSSGVYSFKYYYKSASSSAVDGYQSTSTTNSNYGQIKTIMKNASTNTGFSKYHVWANYTNIAIIFDNLSASAMELQWDFNENWDGKNVYITGNAKNSGSNPNDYFLKITYDESSSSAKFNIGGYVCLDTFTFNDTKGISPAIYIDNKINNNSSDLYVYVTDTKMSGSPTSLYLNNSTTTNKFEAGIDNSNFSGNVYFNRVDLSGTYSFEMVTIGGILQLSASKFNFIYDSYSDINTLNLINSSTFNFTGQSYSGSIAIKNLYIKDDNSHLSYSSINYNDFRTGSLEVENAILAKDSVTCGSESLGYIKNISYVKPLYTTDSRVSVISYSSDSRAWTTSATNYKITEENDVAYISGTLKAENTLELEWMKNPIALAGNSIVIGSEIVTNTDYDITLPDKNWEISNKNDNQFYIRVPDIAKPGVYTLTVVAKEDDIYKSATEEIYITVLEQTYSNYFEVYPGNHPMWSLHQYDNKSWSLSATVNGNFVEYIGNKVEVLYDTAFKKYTLHKINITSDLSMIDLTNQQIRFEDDFNYYSGKTISVFSEQPAIKQDTEPFIYIDNFLATNSEASVDFEFWFKEVTCDGLFLLDYSCGDMSVNIKMDGVFKDSGRYKNQNIIEIYPSYEYESYLNFEEDANLEDNRIDGTVYIHNGGMLDICNSDAALYIENIILEDSGASISTENSVEINNLYNVGNSNLDVRVGGKGVTINNACIDSPIIWDKNGGTINNIKIGPKSINNTSTTQMFEVIDCSNHTFTYSIYGDASSKIENNILYLVRNTGYVDVLNELDVVYGEKSFEIAIGDHSGNLFTSDNHSNVTTAVNDSGNIVVNVNSKIDAGTKFIVNVGVYANESYMYKVVQVEVEIVKCDLDLVVKTPYNNIKYGEEPDTDLIYFAQLKWDDTEEVIEYNGEYKYTCIRVEDNYSIEGGILTELGSYYLLIETNLEDFYSDNYNITNVEHEGNDLIINKADAVVKIVPDDESFDYSGNPAQVKQDWKHTDVSGLVYDENKEDIGLVITGDPKFLYDGSEVIPTNVGEYEISLSVGTLVASAPNYNITFDFSSVDKLVINKAQVTVKIIPKDEEKGYTGEISQLAKRWYLEAIGLLENDTIEDLDIAGEPLFMYDGSTVPPISVGEYEITVSIGTLTYDADNYDVTFNFDSKAKLTITKGALNKPFVIITEYTYRGIEQTFILSGYDSTRMNIEGNKGKNVGKYTIKVSLKDPNNYYWNDTNQDDPTYQVEIVPAEVNITVVPDYEEETYDGKVLTPSGTWKLAYDGLVNGEIGSEVITITGSPVITYTKDGIEVDLINAGDYIATATEGTLAYTSANYKVQFLSGNNIFKIKKAKGELVLSKETDVIKSTDSSSLTVNTNLSGGTITAAAVSFATVDIESNKYITITPTAVIEKPGTIIFTSSETDNYLAATFTFHILITKGDLSYSVSDYVGIYDGDYHGITVLVQTGLIVKYSLTESDYTNTNPKFKNVKWNNGVVDSYTVYYEISGSTEFETVYGSSTVKISPKPITAYIQVDTQTTQYSGNEIPFNEDYSVTNYDGLIAGDTISFSTPSYSILDTDGSVLTTNPVNAGTYTVTANDLVGTNPNYEVTVIVNNGSLVICKISLTIPTAQLISPTYDGLEHTYIPQNYDSGKMQLENNKYKNAGNYTLTVKLTDSNYQWSDGTDTDKNVNYTVLKSTINKIEVLVSKYSQTYNGDTDYPETYTLNTDTILFASDDVNDTTVISRNETNLVWIIDNIKNGWNPNVGEYLVSLDGLVLGSTNYTISSVVVVPNTYTITPADITNVDLDTPLTKTYDGATLYAGVKSATTIDGCSYSVVYTVDDMSSTDKPGLLNAGEIQVDYVISAPNHEDYIGSYKISITKASLGVSLTVNNVTETYTGDLNLTMSYTLMINSGSLVTRDQGKALDDLISVTGTYVFDGKVVMPQNAGKYVITMVDTTASADNYEVTLKIVSGKLEITKAKMTVEVSDLVHTYDGTEKKPTFTVTTVDGCEAVVSCISRIKANEYEDTYTVTAPNHEDYDGSYELIIKKRALSVKVSPVSYTTTYNGKTNYPNQYNIEGYDGLVSNDVGANIVTFDNSSIQYLFGTTVNSLSTNEPIDANEAGYIVSLNGLVGSAENYNVRIDVTNGTYIIYKLSLSTADITITENNIVYDGSHKQPTFTATILLDGSEVELVNNTDYLTSYSNNVNATTEALITLSGINNYKDTASAKFTINKANYNKEPELKKITANVLTIDNLVARLTTIGDIKLVDYYSGWEFASEYNSSKEIYVPGSNVYSVNYRIVMKSTDPNYNDLYDVLYVTIEKNEVSFKELDTITETYDRQTVNVVSTNYVNYFNSLYNSIPSVSYYLNGKSISSSNVVDVNTYGYRLSCIETEYYLAAQTPDMGTIIINPRSIDTLTFTDLSDEVFEYNNAQHTPEVKVYYDTYELNSTNIIEYETNYGPNIDATDDGLVIITGLGNYTGTKIISFDITPRDISNAVIEAIPDQNYTGTDVKPALTVTDSSINKTLYYSVDYDTTYTNCINPGVATVTIIGINNYVGSISADYKIVTGSINPDLIPKLPTTPFKSYVDELLSTLDSELASYNTTDGVFVFWNTEKNEAYPATQVVSSVAGNVIFGVKFIPSNTNYSEVTGLYIQVEVALNASYITIDNAATLKPIYDTYRIDSKNITYSRYEDANETIECVDTDTKGNQDQVSVTFKYYSYTAGVYSEIQAPKNAGTYYVKAFSSATRKYASCESDYEQFVIAPKNISDADVLVEFEDQLPGTYNDFTYAHQAIEPPFKLSYNDDVQLNLVTRDYYIIGIYYNIELGTINGQIGPHIEIAGTGNYTGTRYIEFNIVKKDISELSIEVIADQYYTGSEIKPDLTIYHNSYKLEKDVDYEVVYTNNISVGVATVIVSGKGKYSGTNSTTFNIMKVMIPIEYVAPLENKTAKVGTLLSDVNLGENQYGEWVFVILDTNPNETVGKANETGNIFQVEFRDFKDEYSPYKSTVTIIVTKHDPTLEIDPLDKIYDTLPVSVTYTYIGDATMPTQSVLYLVNSEWTSIAPRNAGSYQVKVDIAASDMYNSISATKNFTIYQAVIGSANVVISGIDTMKLPEPPIQLIPTIEIIHTIDSTQTYKLVYDKDYTYIAGPNNSVGENAGVMYILGMGNYTTATAFETVNFDIVPASGGVFPPGPPGEEATIDISLKYATYIYYDGTEKKPEVIVKDITDLSNPLILSPGIYDVTYDNNINVSKTAEIIVTFTKEYTGTTSTYFEILPYELTKKNLEIDPTNKTYTLTTGCGSGIDGEMVKGTDYIETPQNDGSYLLEGIGNFTGNLEVVFDEVYNVFTLIDENEHYKFATYNKKWNDQEEHTSYDPSKITYLRYVSQGETISKFLTQFKNDSANIKAFYQVVDFESNTVTITEAGRRVMNGTIFNLYDSDNNIIDSFTVIIAGDVNCDGGIDSSDSQIAIPEIDNITYKRLPLIVQLAMDADLNGRINGTDKNVFVDIAYNGTILNKEYKL